MGGQRRSDLHPDVEAMLSALESFPDVTQHTAAELREIIAARRAPLTREPQMRIAQDRTIGGPGGDLAVRIYAPHGGTEPRPVVVFAHGGGFVFHDVETFLPLLTRLSGSAGCEIVTFEYPKVPEWGPAEIAGALGRAIENRLLAERGQRPVYLMGDSVGAL